MREIEELDPDGYRLLGVNLPNWLIERVEAYQRQQHYSSRTEAMRQLMIRALDAETAAAKITAPNSKRGCPNDS
jgi:metal-responsive CopG/Arc/MetJ family transcriptional regulator